MAERIIHVGFGEFQVSSDPNSILTALGLGSCVAVTLYDSQKRLGGMIHVVLPVAHGKSNSLRGKYADPGILKLVEAMEKVGARRHCLVAKMTGGAKILKKNFPIMDLDVGEKNVRKCAETLEHLKIPLEAQDTGGNTGRVAEFHVKTGILIVRQPAERAL